MSRVNHQMKPQDIVILLKIVALGDQPWNQILLSESLKLSQSEISQGINRLKYAGLLAEDGKTIMRVSLVEFLEFGLSYVFPQRPGAIVRGIPTAHAAYPINEKIAGSDVYVWPLGTGKVKGQSIEPLYPTVPLAALKDEKLYALLALVDALRVGRKREKELAITLLKQEIVHGEVIY